MVGSVRSSSLFRFFEKLTTKKALWIIIILGFTVYFNSLLNDFVWDDKPQYLENPISHSISNFFNILGDHSLSYYRPFPTIVFSRIYTIFGPTPFWQHLLQVIVHIVNAILVFFLFKKFIHKTISLFLVMLFLVHPMNVESVVYISGSQTTLSLLFGLTGIHFILSQKKIGTIKYFFIFLFLLLSLLSKETGLFFLIIPAVLFIFRKRFKIEKRDLYFVITAIFFSLMSYLFFKFFYGDPIQRHEFISPVPIMNATPGLRLITLPKVLSYYLVTFVLPKDLAISQQWLVDSLNFKDFYAPLAVVMIFIAMLMVILRYFFKNRKDLHAFAFFFIWFFLSWSFAWQIIPLDMTVADRWFYIPMIGILGMAGVFAEKLRIKNK